MAQSWVPTWRKRLMLTVLDVVARVLLPRGGRGVLSVQAPPDVRRILVIELWNIGDVVLAMPFLGQLRARFPNAAITLLGRPHARVILEGTGLIDEFIETELGWSEEAVRLNPLGYRWSELRRLRRELQRRDFDIAFKARMHIREHVLMALSGARRRVAFAFGSGDRVLTDAIPVGDPDLHKADDWLKLLEPFGGAVPASPPQLHLSEAEHRWATEYLRTHGVTSAARLVGIHPGASVAEKRWPLDRFATVANSVSTQSNVKVLAFVEPNGYGASIGEGNDVITTKVGLRELIALIQRCSILVCNDSGPMHIAGALGVPTVAIFGPGISAWFSPLGEGHHLISHKAAIGQAGTEGKGHVAPFDVTEITVERVLEAVGSALERAVSRG